MSGEICAACGMEWGEVHNCYPKRHPSSQRFHDILKDLGDLHDRKQLDYGTDEDPFNNIRSSAKDWGVKAWVGAMLRATDKVRRLQKFADKGELANESVIDAFDDLAVYAVIARVMYEEAKAQPLCNDCGQQLPEPGETHLCVN